MEVNEEIKKLVEEQQKEIKKKGILFLRCMFSSLAGNFYCMEENADTYAHVCLHGMSIDGSSVIGFAKTENSDMLLRGDPKTLLFVNVEGEECAEVICTAFGTDGRFHPGDPRGIFLNVLKKVKEAGFTSCIQFGELEFFLIDAATQKPHDEAGYCCLPPVDRGTKFRHKLGLTFRERKIKVKRVHHESSPGQSEIELDFDDAIANADGMVRGMQIVRELAGQENLIATFSPKPFESLAGSGLHIHTILYNGTASDPRKTNAFANTASVLSPIGQHFVGGLTTHANEIAAVFALSDRSFIRLLPGHEAPIYNAWGMANRTAMVRIPRIEEGNESSLRKTRIEFRAGDGSGSPYLLAAAILASGLDGIANKTSCHEDRPGFNYDVLTEAAARDMKLQILPRNTTQAKEVLKSSTFLENILGIHARDFLSSFSYTEPKDAVFVPGKWEHKK